MTTSLSITDFSKQWDAVVLLHGLFATKRSMCSAQSALESHGYFAINFGYPTHFRRIEDHLRNLMPVLKQLENDSHIRSINFLAHSFGGILMRLAIARENFSKLARAVMLAPPNRGTHLAKYSVGAFDRLFPAIKEISESEDALPKSLKTPENVQIGIIAAEADFIVREKNTHLHAAQDHCVMPTSHFELPEHQPTIEKSVRFLQEGYFERQASERRAA
ncbi:MAG: hypothetical protein AAF483_18105 [Planctomycetota bacterium]